MSEQDRILFWLGLGVLAYAAAVVSLGALSRVRLGYFDGRKVLRLFIVIAIAMACCFILFSWAAGGHVVVRIVWSSALGLVVGAIWITRRDWKAGLAKMPWTGRIRCRSQTLYFRGKEDGERDDDRSGSS